MNTIKSIIKRSLRVALSPFVIGSYIAFHRAEKRNSQIARFPMRFRDFYPQIKDKTLKTGFDRHYVYHTAWAARVLAETRPAEHIDISSSLYFNGIVSAFIPITFYDYRPADLELSGFRSERGDLMSLPFADKSLQSLSCMHTVEHIGLGRYGDPIDPDGDIKACKELSRVLAHGGSLLFVTPVAGRPKIEWNAHRIYTYDQVIDLFPDLAVKEFAIIPERQGPLIRNADPSLVSDETYACGCFHFVRE